MYTLKKEERLCNKKLIDGLFHNGSSFLCYPFKATWQYSEPATEFPAQVLFAVSKKKFKRAVDRNRLKRMMREAYRLNKHDLLYQYLGAAGKNIVFSIGFIGKELVPFQFTEKKMVKLLKQLCAEIAA
jgi:ribonuclease P protein component